jgi:molecular chaperone DnaK
VRTDSFLGQVVAVLSRRTASFQPNLGEPQTFPGRLRALFTRTAHRPAGATHSPDIDMLNGSLSLARTELAPAGTELQPGSYGIELDYRPIGNTSEPFVGGRLVSYGATLPPGLAVEFEDADARPMWRSGRVPVSDSGTFVTSLRAKMGRLNVFRIALTDAAGRRLEVTPDQLTYTYGLVAAQPLLTQTIGLGLANNELMEVLRKGTPLPGRSVARLRATADIRRSGSTGMIRIPVLEGGHTQADRNRRVGTLEVHPADVLRDVPAGTELEVTIEVDASWLLRTEVYVPYLDAEFSQAIDLATETVTEDAELRSSARMALARYQELRTKARSRGNLRAEALLDQVAADGLVDEVDALTDAGANDRRSASADVGRVDHLNAALEGVEATIRWPDLVQEAEELIQATREIVDRAGEPDDTRLLADREAATRQAITSGDQRALEQSCGDLLGMTTEILDRTGLVQIELLDHFTSHLDEMTDQVKARRLVDEGERAVSAGQISMLTEVNRQLLLLLPDDRMAEYRRFEDKPNEPWSTVIRDDR